MSYVLNRFDYVQSMKAGGLTRRERQVLSACLAIADEQGFFRIDYTDLGPLSGTRFNDLGPALERLEAKGWVMTVGQTRGKLTFGEAGQRAQLRSLRPP